MKINVNIGPNKINYYMSAERKVFRSEVCFFKITIIIKMKKQTNIDHKYVLSLINKDKTVQKALKKIVFFFYSFTRKYLSNDEKITSSSLQ